MQSFRSVRHGGKVLRHFFPQPGKDTPFADSPERQSRVRPHPHGEGPPTPPRGHARQGSPPHEEARGARTRCPRRRGSSLRAGREYNQIYSRASPPRGCIPRPEDRSAYRAPPRSRQEEHALPVRAPRQTAFPPVSSRFSASANPACRAPPPSFRARRDRRSRCRRRVRR